MDGLFNVNFNFFRILLTTKFPMYIYYVNELFMKSTPLNIQYKKLKGISIKSTNEFSNFGSKCNERYY